MPPPHILDIAKRQLDLSQISAATKTAYLEELEKHVQLYPHDTNFYVTLEPGGYGFVTCLEDACHQAHIKLIQRYGAPAQGRRSSGVGSLSAYRAHIASNDAHVVSRNARIRLNTGRVKAEHVYGKAPAPPAASVKSRSRILAALDASMNPSQPTTGSSPSGPLADRKQNRHLLARPSSSAPSPSETRTVKSSNPRKRVSEFHLEAPLRVKKEDPFSDSDIPMSPASSPASKRFKMEIDEFPRPSARPIKREPLFGMPTSSPSYLARDSDVSEVRQKLSDTTVKASRVQGALAHARDKVDMTKADTTRINQLERRAEELRNERHRLNSQIPSMSSVYLQQPVASGSRVPLPPAFQNPSYNNPFGNPAFNHQHDLFNNPAFQPNAAYYPDGGIIANATVGRPIVSAPVPSSSKSALDSPTTQMPGHFPDYPMAIDRNKVQHHRLMAPQDGGMSSDDERFDGDGDFFGRGKDRFAGPVAKADDIDKFLLSAGNAEQFDGNESVDKALEKLGLPALYTPLEGMEVALMPHQAIGVAWMLEKEKGHDKGGCLADEMGLGKTVQMIAIIAKNRPVDPLRKTTLIVAPLALLDQWQLEIEMKTSLDLKTLVYHGQSKPRSLEQLRKYDVILTTYHTLAFEWPDDEAAERAEKAKKKKQKKDDDFIEDDMQQDKKRKPRKNLGLLFQVDWFRIVLDEAQCIRNRRTRISRAVVKLDATYRWCLTGTPIINGLADAYGLLRFLRIRPWYDWQEFHGQITTKEKKQPDLATTRLQAIFASMLLRRKKDTMLDGKRLIELPSKDIVMNKLVFSEEERDIYNMVEAKSQATFNRFLRAGTVLKNYHQVLVLLLRLRQVCSHPCLIQEGGTALLAPGEDNSLAHPTQKEAELKRARNLVSPEFVQRMKAKFRQAALDRIAAEQASADAALEGDDIECPICMDNFADATLTACGHSFCRDCITNVLNSALREDINEPNRYKHNERPCPTCRGPVSHATVFSRAAFEPTDAELKDDDIEMLDAQPRSSSPLAPVSNPGRISRKRKASARRVLSSDDDFEDDEDSMSDFIVDSDEDEEEKNARRDLKKRLRKGKERAREVIEISDDEEDSDVIFGAKPDGPLDEEKLKLMPKFLPSTKMKHMMASLKKWEEECPDEKTLVVSQWTQCLDLVSNYLLENHIGHVKYQGDMSRSQRDKAIRAFMSKDKASVMLMSLKCGGVGLNLTRANRVINLDLGWSMAIEQQAYDRVHRLGQTRPVVVHRLVVSDTVEDRVLALQERKKNLADGSLGEGEGKKIGRLSVRELANLFGLDHRGRRLNGDN